MKVFENRRTIQGVDKKTGELVAIKEIPDYFAPNNYGYGVNGKILSHAGLNRLYQLEY